MKRPHYGDRVIILHHSTRPLSAGDLRRLVSNMNEIGVPDKALIEARTPLAEDRRKVDLAVWVDHPTPTEGEL